MMLALVEVVKSINIATARGKRHSNMHKILLVVLVLVIGSPILIGQAIDEDAEVTQMMDSFVEYNKMHQTVRGWRIQILVTTDRRQMESTRREFELTYPDYKIHYRHDNPFYHLQSGAFITQASARPFLRLMKEKYASAFIVSEEIDLEEVLLYQ
jgi:SPOR domain